MTSPEPRTETTPLLNDADSATALKPASSFRSALSVVVLIAAITLITDFAGYFGYAPQLEIFEKIICRDYFTLQGTLKIDEPLGSRDCKIPAVQAELAIINGWKDTFETLPGKFYIKSPFPRQ